MIGPNTCLRIFKKALLSYCISLLLDMVTALILVKLVLFCWVFGFLGHVHVRVW